MLKAKVQAAPKELLRRGLLTGTEKLKGQLRDASEGGRREDTEADRVQATARMGARLAADKLGRLALRKKKVRSWSGEAVPSTSKPQIGTSTLTPGIQAGSSIPHVGTEPVWIKTREAVSGASPMECHTSPLSIQPTIKARNTHSPFA